IQDDPLTRTNPAFGGAEPAPASPGNELADLPMGPALRKLQARSQPSAIPIEARPAEDPWLKSREAEYGKLNQPAAPLSLKQRILRAAVPAGIMAAGGLIGGRAGAAGAGRGILQQEAVQRGEAEKQQALKEGRSRSLLQEIEAGNYSPVPDAAGNITGWVNPKSRRFVSVEDIPQAGAAATGIAGATLPAKPSGMTAGAIAQAGAIQRAGDNLIAEINAKRGK